MILRWISTLLSKPLDWFITILQMLYLPYFLLFVKSKQEVSIKTEPRWTPEQIKQMALQIKPNKFGIVGKETHCLLTQFGVGLLKPELVDTLLESNIKENGSIHRGINEDGTEMEPYMGPSKDGLTSWVHAYLLWGAKRPDLVKRVANHYLKNCFGLLWNEKERVSSRSSCFGPSVVCDGFPVGKKWWPFKLGLSLPTTGQDVLTTLSLLALAAKELGFIYKIIYYIYWLFSGAFFHAFFPIMYTKKDMIYYVHHIAALNAWNLVKMNKPIYKKTLRYITKHAVNPKMANPWITGLAVNVGAYPEIKDHVNKMILSFRSAERWPQHRMTTNSYLARKTDHEWDMMYYALYLNL